MPAELRINHGSPAYASPSVVPSRDTSVGTSSGPVFAAPRFNSNDIYVYVKVENTGNVDLGQCSCTTPLPATWSGPTFFSGFRSSPPSSTVTQQRFGTTFSQSSVGDSISGPGLSVSLGFSAGERAWDWSPDGRFFAYATSSSVGGTDWHLSIVALQAVTRSNGTVIPKGQFAVSGVSGVFSGAWNNAQFGWTPKAVLVAGNSPASGLGITLACPEAPGNNVWGDLMPLTPGEVDWTFLASPCGSLVAVTPKVFSGSRQIVPISTETAQQTSFKRNNAPTSVQITGSSPSIRTIQRAANGVEIVTGSGTVMVDDPDCTAVVGGSVTAWVDRVKASTLPSANLGVLSVGSAAVSLIKKGQSVWVQVPNTNAAGWGTQGEQHWCLLAQAYTTSGAPIPKPWNGQALSPPQFPGWLVNCAQRNVMIS